MKRTLYTLVACAALGSVVGSAQAAPVTITPPNSTGTVLDTYYTGVTLSALAGPMTQGTGQAPDGHVYSMAAWTVGGYGVFAWLPQEYSLGITPLSNWELNNLTPTWSAPQASLQAGFSAPVRSITVKVASDEQADSPDGATVQVYTGGTYSGGTYSGGTLLDTVSIPTSPGGGSNTGGYTAPPETPISYIIISGTGEYDPTTGECSNVEAVLIEEISFDVGDPVTAPEPASIFSLLAGAVGLAGFGLWRRRAAG